MAVFQIGRQAIKPTATGEIARGLGAFRAGQEQIEQRKVQDQLNQLKLRQLRAQIGQIGVQKPSTGADDLARLRAQLLKEAVSPETSPERRKQLQPFITSGTKVTVQNILPGEPVAATTTTTTKIQDKLLGLAESQLKLNAAMANFDDRFLTFVGKGEVGVARFADKAGVSSVKQKQLLRDYTVWFKPVKQFFQAYKKEITGVAAGEKEIKDIEASTISENMSPVEFRATVQSLQEMGMKLYNRLFMLQVQGFDPNLPENRERIPLSEVPLDRKDAAIKARELIGDMSIEEPPTKDDELVLLDREIARLEAEERAAKPSNDLSQVDAITGAARIAPSTETIKGRKVKMRKPSKIRPQSQGGGIIEGAVFHVLAKEVQEKIRQGWVIVGKDE